VSTPNEGTPLQTAVRKPTTEAERERRRELNKMYRRYKCGECGTCYEDEHYAQTCCPADQVYVCPECDESYHDIDEAKNCHQSHADAEAVPFAFNCCPVCKESQRDHEAAIEHCLWKTMSFADRLQLERLVRYGKIDEAHALLRIH
jgi:hypothetical protein